ncbi:MAG: transcriptional repressor [Clostridia bacterium]|nr:transcriptional repressor [Clostridia bacterium]
MEHKRNYHTRQQEAVSDYFRRHPNSCVTADDIYLFFMRENGKIGKATIYRCLDKLVENGEIKKFISDSGEGAMYQWMDAAGGCDRHFHLKCTACGRIIHLDCGFMSEFEKHIGEHHGFRVDNARTVIYGLCETCADGSAQANGKEEFIDL